MGKSWSLNKIGYMGLCNYKYSKLLRGYSTIKILENSIEILQGKRTCKFEIGKIDEIFIKHDFFTFNRIEFFYDNEKVIISSINQKYILKDILEYRNIKIANKKIYEY
jgi:hypothetical protein